MRHQLLGRSTAIIISLTAILALSAGTVCAQMDAKAGAGSPPTGQALGQKLTLGQRTEAAPADAASPVAYNILDEADEKLFLSLAAWSTKYRTNPGLEDGDWVKYESTGDGPKETLEIRASKADDGSFWIVETRTTEGASGSTELHARFTPGKPKLLQAFRVGADGTREDIELLDDITAGELFMHARTMAVDALGGDSSKVKVYDSGDVQRINGPFGSMLCRSVEVRIAEEVDPISFATTRRWLPEGTLIWLSEDVPRLMPISSILLPALLSPDDMMSVPGGLVRSQFHLLVDYRGRS